MGKKKKKKKKAVRTDSASQPHLTTSQIRKDFIDYNSKGRTPQRFGDTRWQMTDDSQDYAELNNMYKHNGLAHKIVAKPATSPATTPRTAPGQTPKTEPAAEPQPEPEPKKKGGGFRLEKVDQNQIYQGM